jgi:hypothetical protein
MTTTLPTQRAGLPLLIVPVWLVLWIAGLIARGTADAMALVGGPLVVVVVGLLWLWLVAAREEVDAEPRRLVLRRRLGPLKTERAFRAAEVGNLRAERRDGWWGVGGASLAFDHEGRSVHFGGALDDAAAEDLARRLREALR